MSSVQGESWDRGRVGRPGEPGWREKTSAAIVQART